MNYSKHRTDLTRGQTLSLMIPGYRCICGYTLFADNNNVNTISLVEQKMHNHCGSCATYLAFNSAKMDKSTKETLNTILSEQVK